MTFHPKAYSASQRVVSRETIRVCSCHEAWARAQVPKGAPLSSGVVVEQSDGCLYVKVSLMRSTVVVHSLDLTIRSDEGCLDQRCSAARSLLGECRGSALREGWCLPAQVNCRDRRGLLSDVIMALKSYPLEVRGLPSLLGIAGLTQHLWVHIHCQITERSSLNARSPRRLSQRQRMDSYTMCSRCVPVISRRCQGQSPRVCACQPGAGDQAMVRPVPL